MKGTRKDILLQLEAWSKDEQDKQVFWLNGLAGTGKSTIAQTFAEMSFADGRLGASFFCSRNFEGRSNLQTILPTLAFQLAHRYQDFRQELLPVLTACPDVRQESLCSQMEKLIVGPFQAVQSPTLIIIDALDECKDQEPASALLSILSRYVDKIPLIKVFITGRPEPRIRSGFRLKSLQPHTEVFKLHEVEPDLVNSDIKLFLKAQLTEIAINRSDCNLPEGWPGSSNLDILCMKAGGLFIYASTAVKYIASKDHPPAERLADIISFPQSTVEEGKSGIDQLYTGILEQAYSNIPADDRGFYSNLRSVIGAVLLIFNPLPMKALSDLLRVPNISTTPRSLHSLLLVPKSEAGPIRVFHKSFPDFLMDLGRCKVERFFINPSVHHQDILLACLSLMKERLKRNICNLYDYASLDKVNDLSTHRKSQIGDALEYACQFWAKHLVEVPNSGHGFGEAHKAIDEFFQTCLLSWIEVLSLMGILDVGVYALKNIEEWYMLVSHMECIFREPMLILVQAEVSCKWVNDSSRFLLEHFDAIQNSPSHIYHSALPLCPTSSWLRECYSAELSQEVKVVKGLPAEWGPCFRTVSLSSEVNTHTSCKDLIAVGLCSNHGAPHNIIIIDAITGVHLSALSGHNESVCSLTFSSDGALLVSGDKGRAIKLWDIQTGGIIRTLHGHTNMVTSVSISPDHAMIASGSLDETICLWDTGTGECCHVIDWHSGHVNSVCFSPINSQLLISASSSGVIQQWDVKGHKIGPTYEGEYATFSPDGSHFVSWGLEQATVVQNSSSGAIIARLQVSGEDPFHCCFSPDGRFVAGSDGETVYIWDITNSDPLLSGTFTGHTALIKSLAYPSSHISSAEDGSIKLWQFSTLLVDQATTSSESIPLTPAPVKLVSLQTKDNIAISVDLAGVVRSWDTSTGLCKATFQAPAPAPEEHDLIGVQLIHDRMVLAWFNHANHLLIWDSKKGYLSKVACELWRYWVIAPKISGDGSKVFLLIDNSIRVFSVQTGEFAGQVKFEGDVGIGGGEWPDYDPSIVDGSRVWVHCRDSQIKGWDFGILDSAPVPLSSTAPDSPHLELNIKWNHANPYKIKDRVTDNDIFQLSGRYANPTDVQWDGQHLVAGYRSGEVVILDFCHMSHYQRDMVCWPSHRWWGWRGGPESIYPLSIWDSGEA